MGQNQPIPQGREGLNLHLNSQRNIRMSSHVNITNPRGSSSCLLRSARDRTRVVRAFEDGIWMGKRMSLLQHSLAINSNPCDDDMMMIQGVGLSARSCAFAQEFVEEAASLQRKRHVRPFDLEPGRFGVQPHAPPPLSGGMAGGATAVPALRICERWGEVLRQTCWSRTLQRVPTRSSTS